MTDTMTRAAFCHGTAYPEQAFIAYIPSSSDLAHG